MTPLLLGALLAVAKPPRPPPPPPVSKEERAKQVALKVLKRIPRVAWQEDRIQSGDINNDRLADAVALGIEGDDVLIAVLAGPVSGATAPLVLRFRPPKGDHPAPGDVCGDPKELVIGLEPPGVKPSELACAGTLMTPECRQTLALERRLQGVRDRGGKGIRLSGGKCLPLHIYFDQGRARWWRND